MRLSQAGKAFVGAMVAMTVGGCPSTDDLKDDLQGELDKLKTGGDMETGGSMSSGGTDASGGGSTGSGGMASTGGTSSSGGSMTTSSSFDADAFPECWNRLWEGCFDPAGACVIRGTDVAWDNGAEVTTTINGIGSATAYTNSSGTACATIEQSVDLATQALMATVKPGNGDEQFTYTIDQDGNWSITCDGETHEVDAATVEGGTYPAEEGEDDAACTVEGGFTLPGTGGDGEPEEPVGELSEACAALRPIACDEGCPDNQGVMLTAQCGWAEQNMEELCCSALMTFRDVLDSTCGWGDVTVPDSCN